MSSAPLSPQNTEPNAPENTTVAPEYSPPADMHYSHFQLPVEPETPSALQYSTSPVIWDLGSHRMRVGYASGAHNSSPYLTYKPLLGKLRGATPSQKSKYRGNEFVSSLFTKLQSRSAYTNDVITNQSVMEDLLDYGWEVLGMGNAPDDTSGIPNTCIITETICNPTSTRAILSELLFEYYNIPNVLYGVDAMFSLYKQVYDVKWAGSGAHNVLDTLPANALIIRSGHHATHILPVVNQHLDVKNIKKLPIGGHHTTEYTSKLIQNKYPLLRQYLTATATGTTTAERLKEQHMYVPQNYWEELQRLALDEKYYYNQTHIVQMPYTPQQVIQQKSAQEIQEQEERKKQRQAKLERLARERNEEKLRVEEETLNYYMQMKDMRETDPDTYSLWMTQYGFVTEEDLERGIADIRGKQERRAKRREEKERRKQKLEQQAVVAASQKSPMDLLKESDPQEWLKQMKEQRNELKKQLELKKVDAGKASGSRGRRAASKKRLKAIASTLDTSEKETNFGRADEDWDVYREIGTSTLDTLESQEALLEQMQDDIDDMELALFDRIMSQEKKMHYMHQYNFLAAASSRRPNPTATRHLHEAEFYQYQLTVERIRAPEVVFQPTPLLGMKNCGLMEMIEICMSRYEPEVVRQMMQNVHLCGGNTRFEGMQARVENELRAMLPVDYALRVTAEESVDDAWRGGSYAARDTEYVQENAMTRDEYYEYGGEYLKEHALSNRRWPKAVPVGEDGEDGMEAVDVE